MSTAASTTAAEALPEQQAPSTPAPSQPKDHVPHVLSLKWYFGVFVMLLIFTALTVAASYVKLGDTIDFVIAMGIATCKAVMVAAIFMHLLWDSKFNVVVFLSSLIFLAIFVTFTWFDTGTRGRLDPVLGERPADVTMPFEGPSPVSSGRRGAP